MGRIGAKGSSWYGKGLPSGNLEFTSNIIRNNLNPVWDSTFSIDGQVEEWISQLSTDRLEVCLKLFDNDIYPKELGEICQEIVIVDKGTSPVTVPVKGKHGQGTVDIAFFKSRQAERKNIKESRVETV